MAPPAPEPLPASARTIALLLASTPSVHDAQPGVLHQLLEFAHRYTNQVLTDALVYAEHAGHPGKLERDDVVVAVQARVGWEFGGHIPKEYLHTLAAQTNAAPLPAVPEVFGVRLPPEKERLTQVDFDLVPNKPPPAVILYEDEEVEVDDDEEELGDENGAQDEEDDVEMEDGMEQVAGQDDIDDEDGLFAGDEDDDEEAMEEVETSMPTAMVNGHEPPKRQLVEEDDYD